MMMNMIVSVGDSVEIICEEEGFWGAYYEAKILAKKSNNNLLVEYKNLVTEKDEKVLLREIVEARRVRPVPPPVDVSEFNILQKIDAFDNDGWWEGRITKKLDDFNYSVYFETSGDHLNYSIDRLRIHQDYVYGDWISSPTHNYSVFLNTEHLRCR